jgi:hypothetical protein
VTRDEMMEKRNETRKREKGIDKKEKELQLRKCYR